MRCAGEKRYKARRRYIYILYEEVAFIIACGTSFGGRIASLVCAGDEIVAAAFARRPAWLRSDIYTQR